MTTNETVALIRVLFAMYHPSQKPDMPTLVPVWQGVLRDVDPVAAQAAVKENTSRFMPSAPEVRELALARSGDAPTGEADTVATVVTAIGRYGLTGWEQAKAMLDPFALAVVKAAGGWSNLCRSNADYVATAVRLAHRSTREAWATAGSPAMSELTPTPTVRALAPAGDGESDRDRHLAAVTAHRPSALADRIAARAALAPVVLPADTVSGPYRQLSPRALQGVESAAMPDRVRALAENVAANSARNGAPITPETDLPRRTVQDLIRNANTHTKDRHGS